IFGKSSVKRIKLESQSVVDAPTDEHLARVERGFTDAFTSAWNSFDEKKELLKLVAEAIDRHHNSPQVLDKLFAACLHIIKTHVVASTADHGTLGTRVATTPQSVPFLSPPGLGNPSSPMRGAATTPNLVRSSSAVVSTQAVILTPVMSAIKPPGAPTPSTRSRVHGLADFSACLVTLLTVEKPHLWLHILGFIQQLASSLDSPLLEPHTRQAVLVSLNCLAFVDKAVMELCQKFPATQLTAQQRHLVGAFQALLDGLVFGRTRWGHKPLQAAPTFASTAAPALSLYDLMAQVGRIVGQKPLKAPAKLTVDELHWSLLPMVQRLLSRETLLTRLVLPPDASEPVIVGMTRPHDFVYPLAHGAYYRFAQDPCLEVRYGAIPNVMMQLNNLLAQGVRPNRLMVYLDALKNQSLAQTLLCRAVFKRVRSVLEYIRSHSDFETPNPAHREVMARTTTHVPVPSDLWFRPMLLSLADMVIGLYRMKLLPFDALFNETYKYFYPSDTDAMLPRPSENPLSRSPDTPERDNGYIWVLMQLIGIEGYQSAMIRNDFAKTEDYLAKLVQLYNDHQTMSVDSYYPRDLALHCVIRCQHNNISDVPNLKYRHPTIAVAMPHFVSDQEMQRAIREKANAIVSKERVDVDGFLHLTPGEVIQLGLFSQSQYMYATQILCGYLFPTPVQVLPQSYCFAKLLEYKACGKISQDILESLSVAAGERLAQFLNRLSIDWYSLPENLQAPCASPVALDTFYRLTLVLPSTCEPIVNDILQRLNIMDAQVAKAAAMAANTPAGNLSASTASATQPGTDSDAANNASQILSELWVTKTLWLQTVVQLVAYRLMRYLRDSHHAPTLLNCVVHLLQQAPCRQLHQSLETLVMQILTVQSDQRLFEALLGYRPNPKNTAGGQTNQPQPSRLRPIWFADNEMLARRLVMTLAHLVKTCDTGRRLTQETVHTVLGNCGSGPRLVWSTTTLAYFPPVVRDYYIQAYAAASSTGSMEEADGVSALASPGNGGNTPAALPAMPMAASADPKARATTPVGLSTSPTVVQVNHIISQDDVHNILILGEADQRNEQALLDFYACEANQQLFLCVLWTIVEIQNEVHPFTMRYVRRILRSFPANHLTSYTVALVDFVLEKPLDDTASDQGYLHHGRLLDDFIWKYQILNLDHVVFALCRGHRALTAESPMHHILQYLLFDSEALQARLTHWRSQGFSTQPWTDVDHFNRLCQYLERFPEFHDYEAFQAQTYADLTTMPALDPPHSPPLPVFYETQIQRLIHGLDYLVARCLEQEDKALLCRLLTTYGDLVKTHYQFPLRFVQNTLHYYYDSALLRDHEALQALFSVLDWDQYAFTPEFQSLVTSDALNIFELLSSEYITKLLEHTVHLTQPMSGPPHSSPCSIAQQYREYSNPWMFGLHHLATEIMVLSLLLEEKTSTAQSVDPQEQHIAYGHNLVLISLMNLVGQPWLLRLSRTTVPATHPLQLLAATFALLPAHAFSRPAVIHVVHCIKTGEGAPLAEVTPACLQSWFETMSAQLKGRHGPGGTLLPDSNVLISAVTRSPATNGNSGSSDDALTADATKFPALPPMQSYIFNPYVANYEHFTSNVPNCYLTFFHSLVKYSGIDVFYTVHAMLRSLRSPSTLNLVAATSTAPLDELLPSAGEGLPMNNGSGSAGSATGGASTVGGPMSTRSNVPTTPAGLAATLTAIGGATPATPTPGFPATPGRALHPPAASPAPLLAFNQPTPLGQPLALLTSTPTPLRAASSLSLGDTASVVTAANGGKVPRRPNHHPGLMGTRDLTTDFAIVDAIHQRLMSTTGSSPGALSSDAQLLYLLALVGPTLYRLDSNSASGHNHGHKIEDGLLLRALMADLLWLLVEISAMLPLYGHHSTLGVETIVDFFHHVRASFAHDGQAHTLSLTTDTPSAVTFWRDLEPIIQQLKEPLRCRIVALCYDRKS
ncbi:hypothetical protein H4R34_003309, partial [Dimargaris verticillata]